MKRMILLVSFIFYTDLSLSLPVRSGEHFRVAIDGQYIVKAPQYLIQEKVLKRIGENLFLIETDGEALSSTYSKIYPNYQYFGDYLEGKPTSPNDTYFSKQVHHSQILTLEAWNITQGDQSIIVAVTDNEFQLDHKDLEHSLWKNEKEIPDNGIDDDQNGYIDDIYGWDFLGNDNNVDSTEDPTHGTHVSGIITALDNNSYGGVGIAPKVKLMPLRWYGSDGDWTTAVIAETYLYAINHGAKIISTSYNIDHLVDDQLYRDVVTLARENSILIFNSAGNNNIENPERQKIEEIILVCSVTSSYGSKDKKSRSSNYGTGIDICAPGDPIFSTVQIQYGTQDRYAEFSGTSMAAPVAAAVAALIWSSHLNFSDLEVLDKLYQSADDLGDKNSSYKGLLGAGRVNALKAVE